MLRAPLVAVPLATWLFLVAISGPLAWWEPLAAVGRGLAWLRFVCFFAAVVFWLFADEGDFRKVVICWGAVLAVVIVDGLVQGFFGTSLSGRPIFEGQRLTGPLKRPNIGRFVAFLFYPCLAAYLLHAGRALDARRMVALALVLAVVVFFTVFSAERSATLLGLATVTGASIFLMARGRWYTVAGLGAIAASYAISALAVMANARLQIRIAPTAGIAQDFWNSEYGELIRAAVTAWKVQPATGVGLGNFMRVCDAFEPELAFGCLAHPHNIYLEWLAEAGAPGLAGLAVFALIATVSVLLVLRLWKKRPLFASVAAVGTIPTLFPLVPSQSFFSNWPAILWWSSLALACATALHALRRAGDDLAERRAGDDVAERRAGDGGGGAA